LQEKQHRSRKQAEALAGKLSAGRVVRTRSKQKWAVGEDLPSVMPVAVTHDDSDDFSLSSLDEVFLSVMTISVMTELKV
jgi:hypothetical protein